MELHSIPSPCVGVCRLDEHDRCSGCGRSREEIAAWSTLENSERLAIMARLAEAAES